MCSTGWSQPACNPNHRDISWTKDPRSVHGVRGYIIRKPWVLGWPFPEWSDSQASTGSPVMALYEGVIALVQIGSTDGDDQYLPTLAATCRNCPLMYCGSYPFKDWTWARGCNLQAWEPQLVVMFTIEINVMFFGDQLLSSIRTQSDSRTISLLKPSRQ